MDEELISRGELVELLFAVQDIRVSLARIERLLEGDDGEEADES
jgi:hypothetical protein